MLKFKLKTHIHFRSRYVFDDSKNDTGPYESFVHYSRYSTDHAAYFGSLERTDQYRTHLCLFRRNHTSGQFYVVFFACSSLELNRKTVLPRYFCVTFSTDGQLI